MFTIDIEIPPAPPIAKMGGGDSGQFHLYNLSGYFYLPKGFLTLLNADAPEIRYADVLDDLNTIPEWNVDLYNKSSNLGLCYPTTKPNEVKDGWAVNTYIKSKKDIKNRILEVYKFFLIEGMKEINTEEGISNEEINNISNLVYFDGIQINEIHNKDVKNKIDEDFF